MKKIISVGATDQTLDVFIQASNVTTGAGLTGLVYNSASLVCYYRKGATGTATALTLATQTVGGAHSDGGFVEIDATNMPGMYRLDLSDTIVAAEGSVTLILKGATNMAPVTIELQVVSVTRGLAGTALPAAAADAAGGLIISDAGGLDADAQRTDVAAILVDTGTTLDGRIPAALVNGKIDAALSDVPDVERVLVRYGTAATINFSLRRIDGAGLKVDAAHAAGDTKLMKDEAPEANTTNGFTDEGQGYAIALTAAELQAARGVLYIVDQGTKAWADKVVVVETYGHPAAQHPFLGAPSYELAAAGAPQAASATVIRLPATASTDNDAYRAIMLYEVGVGSIIAQGSYDGSTKDFTMDPAPGLTFTTGAYVMAIPWPAAPTASIPAVNVEQWKAATAPAMTGDAYARLGAPVGASISADLAVVDGNVDSILVDTAEIGAAGAGLTNINLPNQTMDITGNITGNLSGSVGSVTGAVGSVTGLTAADVAAIKAKTDSLTFTVSNVVDSNVQRVNDVAITGTGTTGDEWGPA